MATPCDALRTQAEARLQQLARRVTAHRKVKNYEEAEEALKEQDALVAVLSYIDETSEQVIKARVICSELELDVPTRISYSSLCESSFQDLIERYPSVLLRKQEEGCDSDELQEIVRKLRALRDGLDELDADNSSVELTVALDGDDTGRQTTDFEAEEILAPPPLKDLVDAALNSRPLPSLPQVVTLRVAGFVPTEALESLKATRAPARVGSGSARSAPTARAGVTRKTCTLNSVLDSIDRRSQTLNETLESQMNVDNLAGAAKTRQLLDTNVEMCNDIAKFFGKGTCRVRFMLSPMMDAGHEFTMSRAHLYDKSLIEVINIARRSLDEELIAAKNKDTFDELRDDFKFMDDLRRRLAERDAEPNLVSLFVHVDDSAENTRELLVAEDDYDAPPLLSPPIDELISALTERGPYPVLPRALTVSITNKRLEEVLSAPRCLLVAVDPGARHEVFAIDENARETPLVDFALKVMLGRDAVEALTDDARDAHLKRVRQTAAVAVSTFQDADTTDGGHKRRADILAELRTGKLKLRDVETINAIDATLGDATDAKAPFVFLHVSGCAHLHEVETRATLSVRDSCGRKVVTVDGVFQSLGMEPPVSLKGLLNLLMQSAQLRTSNGAGSRQRDSRPRRRPVAELRQEAAGPRRADATPRGAGTRGH